MSVARKWFQPAGSGLIQHKRSVDSKYQSDALLEVEEFNDTNETLYSSSDSHEISDPHMHSLLTILKSNPRICSVERMPAQDIMRCWN